MTAIVRVGTRYLFAVVVLLAWMLTSCTRGSQESPVEDQKSSPQHHQLLMISVGGKKARLRCCVPLLKPMRASA